MTAQFLELAMLVLFGCSWPFAIARTYRAKRVDGKSPFFMIIVIIGYMCGIAAHLVEGTKLWLCWVYMLDILLVSIDLALYFYYAQKRLYVATGNAHKLKEIAQILRGFKIIADNPVGVEETASDFAGNALIKVRAISGRHPGAWCMADDSGLEVDALNGAPGVRSARYAGEPSNTANNNALLLKNLEGIDDRKAQFNCIIAMVDPSGKEHVVSGHCPGHIALSPSGVQGFGYDPLFIPEGGTRSFAELSPDEKNAISHRANALKKLRELIEFLGKNNK